MPQAAMEALEGRIAQIRDLQHAAALLQWDQEVHMPPKGAPARGRQLATLSALAHRLLVAGETRKLMEKAESGSATFEKDAQTHLREIRYEYDRATRLPEAFVQHLAEVRSNAYHAWVDARAHNAFETFRPHLEKIVDLMRAQAEYIGYEESPYDALLEEYERGMTAAQLRPIFGTLGERQRTLVRAVGAAPPPDTAWLAGEWDVERQWAFTMEVLRDLGYDLEAGRQDRSVHPFTTSFDLYDVRITTRFDPHDPFSALMGTIHECGHALYEQGFRPEDQLKLLGDAPGLGIHESQSRLWENVIGRSLPFWEHYLPRLQEHFPGQLAGRTAEDIYRAVNRVAPSFIRVEADECTYNLHVILRFELEVELIEGRLQVADVPEAWNAKVKDYLGLDVPDDAHGCLQDIHWSHASFGYFPTYTLGNLYAAQLCNQIEADLPGLWEDVRAGRFGPLLAWLRTHVHEVGRRKLGPAIVEAAAGAAPSPEPYLQYLESKYRALYGLDK